MKFQCADCGQHLAMETMHAGQAVQCPACGASITTPVPGPTPSAEVIKTLQSGIDRGNMTISQYMAQQQIEGGVDLAASDTGSTASGILTAEQGRKYKLGDVVASGGMGAILDAKDVNLRRNVAMKVMLDPAKVGKDQILRFIQEAQVTSQIEHPSIVPVYELGVDASGNVFYTMKFVHGRTLKDILKKISEGDADTVRDYPLSHLLTIFQKVCDAMAFAHSKRVIHRDLKPENIMVGDYGEVQVMDWGLAKVLPRKKRKTFARDEGGKLKPEKGEGKQKSQGSGFSPQPSPAIDSVRGEETGDILKTMDGSIMGTPGFMSPEQALGKTDEIDERTDIYALGAILYNILTLNVTVKANSLADLINKVTSGEIRKPTEYNQRRTGETTEGRDGDASGFKAQVSAFSSLPHLPDNIIPDSLSAVAMRALEVEAHRRYQKVKDLQKEIEAYQGGFATSAEAAGTWKQVKLFVGRHKGLTIAAGIILGLVVTGSVISTSLWLKAEKQRARAEDAQKAEATERQRAEAEQKRAVAAEQQAQKETAAALISKEAEITERKKADERERTARRLLYDSRMSSLMDTFDDAPVPFITETLKEYEGKTGADDLRGFEWYYLSHRTRGYYRQFPTNYITAVFNSKGDILAVDDTGSLHTLDPETGRETAFVKGVGWDYNPSKVVVSKDGKTVVHTGPGPKIALFSPDGSVKTLEGHTNRVWGAAFHPGGSLLASASEDGTVRIWDVASKTCVHTLSGNADSFTGVAFSPDGRLLAATCGRLLTRITTMPVYLWDTKTWEQRARFEGHSQAQFVRAIGFSADSRLLYTAASELKVWNTDDNKLALNLKLQDYALDLAVSPSGNLLALSLLNNKTILLKTADMEQVNTFRGHLDFSVSLAFSPDGRFLFSCGSPPPLLWEVASAANPLTIKAAELKDPGTEDKSMQSKAYQDSPIVPFFVNKGASVIYPDKDRKVLTEFNSITGQRLRTVMNLPPEKIPGLFAFPDGNFIVVATEKQLLIHSLADGKHLFDIERKSAQGGSYSPKKKLLAMGTLTNPREPGLLRVFSMESGKEIVSQKVNPPVCATALDAEGKRLAVSLGIFSHGVGSTVYVRDVTSGKILAGEWHLPRRTGALAFSRDGRFLFGGGYDKQVHVWNLNTGKEELVLKGHTGEVSDIAVSPDGRNLATGDVHGAIILWDQETGQVRATFRGNEDTVTQMIFSPDSQTLSSIDSKGTIRHWRTK